MEGVRLSFTVYCTPPDFEWRRSFLSTFLMVAMRSQRAWMMELRRTGRREGKAGPGGDQGEGGEGIVQIVLARAHSGSSARNMPMVQEAARKLVRFPSVGTRCVCV